MWWLSQAKLKDVLNRWICSSFQPMSAQNIPHLDPRGSWKHFCGTSGELNCMLLMYRMSCKRYWTKIRSLGEAPRFREQNTQTRWSSLVLLLITNSWGFGVCLQQRPMHVLCCKNSLDFLIVTEHNIWQERWFSPNCSRELTKNFKLKGKGKEGDWHKDTVLATSAKSWPKEGGKGQGNGYSSSAHVGLCSGVTRN